MEHLIVSKSRFGNRLVSETVLKRLLFEGKVYSARGYNKANSEFQTIFIFANYGS